jgi:hypothetical protein
MANPLDRIEERIEQFVEGALSRLIGIQISAVDVAAQLARALSEGVRRTEEGKPFAPDKYALTFHPEDAQTLLENAPELRVVAWHSTAPLEFTQAMQREPKTNPGALPSGAYLIVEGNRHFPLDRPVVNIGRRLDNHIILDDPRVSRTHAQIRIRNGRFEIFDLGSSAGTLVNGQDVRQHMLQTGDVVELAGTRLVYGEDPGGPPDETPAYSPPFPPKPSGDQRTRITPRNNDEKS